MRQAYPYVHLAVLSVAALHVHEVVLVADHREHERSARLADRRADGHLLSLQLSDGLQADGPERLREAGLPWRGAAERS